MLYLILPGEVLSPNQRNPYDDRASLVAHGGVASKTGGMILRVCRTHLGNNLLCLRLQCTSPNFRPASELRAFGAQVNPRGACKQTTKPTDPGIQMAHECIPPNGAGTTLRISGPFPFHSQPINRSMRRPQRHDGIKTHCLSPFIIITQLKYQPERINEPPTHHPSV